MKKETVFSKALCYAALALGVASIALATASYVKTSDASRAAECEWDILAVVTEARDDGTYIITDTEFNEWSVTDMMYANSVEWNQKVGEDVCRTSMAPRDVVLVHFDKNGTPFVDDDIITRVDLYDANDEVYAILNAMQ